MSKKYDTLVLIGRFQPVHNAHVQLIRRATELAKQVVIIVGSAGRPRTFENPWSGKERRMMLQNVIDDMGIESGVSVRLEENYDTIYDNTAWAGRVQSIVAKYTQPGDHIGLIGHKKDAKTADYLDMFPQWGREEVALFEPLNATSIRALYFTRDMNMNFLARVIPEAVYAMLTGWKNSPDREQVIREREFIIEHNKQYEGLKYPPIFVTVDALVIQSGHVLLGRRRAEPGKDLLAFPGGYMNALTDASILAAMLRELREETKIDVPDKVLAGSITQVKVFDALDRSPRGRIITHVHKIVLPNGPLPKVKGADDMKKPKFIPISSVRSEECFEDHFEIFKDMV